MMHLLEWLGAILLWLYAERIKRFCRGTLTVAWRLATLHRTRLYLHYAIWIGACKAVNAWTEQGLIKRQPTARPNFVLAGRVTRSGDFTRSRSARSRRVQAFGTGVDCQAAACHAPLRLTHRTR
jgi:hypothetical protein